MTRGPVEPSSVRFADTRLAPELLNAVYSLGFYVACGAIGVLPRRIGAPLLTRYVSWAAAMDESRPH